MSDLTATDAPLFEGYEPPAVTPTKRPELSPDRRRTLRMAADVKRGVHPLMGGPLHEQADRTAKASDPKNLPFTCGSCSHRLPSQGHHDWPKCGIGPRSGCVATDCRAWWPACPRWEPKP